MPSNNGTRRKRAGQKGVQAIFTPNADRKIKALGAIGLAGLVSGAGFWVWALQPSRSLTGFSLFDEASSSLIIFSLAIPLAMAGIGLCAYSFAVRRVKRENERIQAILYKLEEMMGPKDNVSNPASLVLSTPGPVRPMSSKWRLSRSLGAAFLEGALLIIVYYGLVTEYKFNIRMQEWVKANMAFGGMFLNDVALWLISGLVLGVLTIQLRVRDDSPAQSRRK